MDSSNSPAFLDAISRGQSNVDFGRQSSNVPNNQLAKQARGSNNLPDDLEMDSDSPVLLYSTKKGPANNDAEKYTPMPEDHVRKLCASSKNPAPPGFRDIQESRRIPDKRRRSRRCLCDSAPLFVTPFISKVLMNSPERQLNKWARSYILRKHPRHPEAWDRLFPDIHAIFQWWMLA